MPRPVLSALLLGGEFLELFLEPTRILGSLLEGVKPTLPKHPCLCNATWRRTARSNDLTESRVLNGSWQIRFSIKLWLFGSFKIILLPWYDCYKQYCTTNASPIIMTLAIRRTANRLPPSTGSSSQRSKLDSLTLGSRRKRGMHTSLSFICPLTSEAHPILLPHSGQP